MLDFTFTQKLNAALDKYEGRRDYFYRDSVGQVTIGIGILVPHESDAVKFNLRHRSSQAVATSDEILLAYRAVKAASITYGSEKGHKIHTWGSGHYRNIAGNSDIYMPDFEINRLRDLHVIEFTHYLRRSFSIARGYKREFDQFPDNVRLALYDMMFNLGPTKFPAHWTHFVQAIKAEDWNAASHASLRPQLNAERNHYVRALLASAAKGLVPA